MSSRVPFLDLGWMHAEVADEIREGFERVMAETAFAGGPDVAAFEHEFALASGRQHCVGTANGTDAIEMALRALQIGSGDEVIVPANTFIATVEAVWRAGADTVLVDVNPDTLLIDPDAAAAAVGPRTAAIIPVHLYGQMAPMETVQQIARQHGLAVIEDAAQAQGALRGGDGIGTGSDAAATSFYPGKNLGAYGDAGAVVTDAADLAERMRLLGNHGSAVKYEHVTKGFNSRLDTLQAVVLRAKLRRLERWNDLRREVAAGYGELLGDLDLRLPVTDERNLHVWHLYVVRVAAAERQRVLDALAAAGVGSGIHYPRPIHLHEAFADLGYGRGSFPVSEQAADEMVSLPMYPGLSASQQQTVAGVLRMAIGESVPAVMR